ncbi:HORMA domain-containing protein 2 isoform X4 [Balearica regulorum gibbericeps]|uniref:HORMA domain-containing protein 2 isoform X4 n=1 Tax=Balearica regulorum gibbericeps TaxID=100784 RepID=UPI003F5E0192
MAFLLVFLLVYNHSLALPALRIRSQSQEIDLKIDLCLKILREDKSCLGSLQIVKWIQGCFDALERQYLHIAVLAIYTNPKEPETVTELYQFKFKYKKEVPQMDIISNQMNVVNGVCSKDVRQASRLLIRKLYLLMQNLGPLPDDVTLTMKLLYYNDVTPKDYQPPGFKEDGNAGDLLFDGDPVNLRVGSVSTGFHLMKVRVITEKKRMGTVESNLIQKNGPTEISHQGLDCDEEEEEGSTKNRPLPVQADSSERGRDKSDTHPGWKTETSFYFQDTGGKKTGIKETGRMLCSRASQQLSCLNLAFSQQEVIGPKKKRKYSTLPCTACISARLFSLVQNLDCEETAPQFVMMLSTNSTCLMF